MDNEDNYDIAIIGMSGRFPGAKNLGEFWDNLINTRESIAFFTDEALISNGIDPALVRRPDYVKAMPVLDGPGLFDAAFFGYSPGEAAIIDPQHRLLLECAWEALEDAGYDPFRVTDPIGVFAGAAMNTYFMNSQLQEQYTSEYIPTLIANDKDFLCTRVSYKLNLSGPSITVQTACSTALVAVHMACQSLLNEESAMVLAGAMTVRVPHQAGYLYQEGGVASPDGHCRPFDKSANGSIFGSGGGVVVLKRLDQAKNDRDHIYAIIKGSAVNNDGAEKAGYTAPGVKSQANVVSEAQANAGTDPESITFIEAHGSGTAMGDPIEVAALTSAFRTGTSKRNFCALGSVKSNVGHLDVAAGMAGLVKTTLALNHKKIPPTVHFSAPNPLIDFENSPFFVNSETLEWESGGTPRRAGLSASGMGGTNAHLVLEEAPRAEKHESAGSNLLVLSAKTEQALQQAKKNLLDHLNKRGDQNISDIAYTLQVGRREFDHKFYMVCSGHEDAITQLQNDNGSNDYGTHQAQLSPVIFLFPGIGDQYVGMGYGLYQHEPFFRSQVDRCAEIIKSYTDVDIIQVLYPEGFTGKKPGEGKQGIDLKQMLFGEEQPDEHTIALNKTVQSQAALFTIEYALARLWMHWGIKPDMLVGHSLGEYVAACISGVFSVEDALYIISERARLVEALPPGAMIAVTLSEEALLPYLSEDLSISLINGPSLCVVAGPEDRIAALEVQLSQQDILYRQVKNSQAFHSRMLDPVIAPFTNVLEKINYHPPRIPFLSNVSGKWVVPSEVVEPAYWARHANHTVRFNDGLHSLWSEGSDKTLLEVGPGLTISTLATQHPSRDKKAKPTAISSLRPQYNNRDDMAYLYDALGKLWVRGYRIDWQKHDEGGKRGRVPLPTYPFERRNFWLKPERKKQTWPEAEQKSGPDQWLYAPTWKRLPALNNFTDTEQEKQGWLIFSDAVIGPAMAQKLEALGYDVVRVYPGDSFKRISGGSFEINPSSLQDYTALLEKLSEQQQLSGMVLHCWSCEDGSQEATGDFDSLFYLAQAIGEQNILTGFHLTILSSQVYEVTGNEKVNPFRSLITGPCKVIPKEYPNITCKNIDIGFSGFAPKPDEAFPDTLLAEIQVQTPDRVVALRGRHRWAQNFEPVTVPEAFDENKVLRPEGVYVITGGLGSLGMYFAGFLAKEVKARLVLIGRSPFPERTLWEEWLSKHEVNDPISGKIRQMQDFEKKGAEVTVISADTGDENQMLAAFSTVYEKYGAIHGVLHAAGIVKDKLIQLKSKGETEEILHPKVKGTTVLLKILQTRPADFLVLFSSVSTYIAPPGHADYCAASAFMDAFALVNSNSKQKVISVNWPLWKEIGMLEQEYENNPTNPWVEKALREAITPREGVELFIRVLGLQLPQVVISKYDFTSKVQEAQSATFANAPAANTDQITAKKEARVQKAEGPEGFANETEQLVAECWQEVLGMDHIGVHEKFTDIGGHSLLAIQIITRLTTIFKKKISVADILNASTISQLATLINKEKETEDAFPELKPLSREHYRINNIKLRERDKT